MTEIFDVAVVGSGPAGSAAATMLATNGASVVMIEKAALPRYKTCGGGVLPRARRLLQGSIDGVVEHECYAATLNFADSGISFPTSRAEPLISMTMRSMLDHQLVLGARAAGTSLMESCTVLALQQDDDLVRLQTSQGEVCARFVIAADGANSFVATAAGWTETRRLIPALEYEVQVLPDDLKRLSASARFDFGIVNAGYAWTFPKRSHLSVGVLSMRRGKVQLQKALHNYLRLIGITEPLSIAKHGYVIPVTPRKDALARGRVLLTGDAAGLVDPVTAEGITHAIVSGQTAAEVLQDCAFDVRRVARTYQSRIDETLLRELRAGRLLARLLYEHPRLRAWVFRRHGAALSELVTDVVTGTRSYRDALFNRSSWLRLVT